MGDRCFLTVHVREAEEERLRAKLGDPCDVDASEYGGCVRLDFEEVNYAAHSDLMELHEEGMVFIAYNSAGVEYPDACQLSWGGKLIDYSSGNPLVEVRADGPEPTAWAAALAFIEAREQMRAGMGEA